MITIINATCYSKYNNIDQNHIDSTNKRIFLSLESPEILKLRLLWGNSFMPLTENRIPVTILGRKNYSHILDKWCEFKLKISKPTEKYKKKKFILISAKIIFDN